MAKYCCSLHIAVDSKSCIEVVELYINAVQNVFMLETRGIILIKTDVVLELWYILLEKNESNFYFNSGTNRWEGQGESIPLHTSLHCMCLDPCPQATSSNVWKGSKKLFTQ